MGLITPLDDDLDALELARRIARCWVAVANEGGPLAHPTLLTADNRRGEVCWWIGSDEAAVQ